MIRLIDLKTQTSAGAGARQFALWNTVSDTFLNYNGSQAWYNADCLQNDLLWHLGAEQAEKTFKRIEPLIPKWAR